METALPSMCHVQRTSATGTRAQPAKSPKKTHTTVGSQPESPPKTVMKRNQWLENQGQWSWVSVSTHNALRKTIKSKQWASTEVTGGSIWGHSCCHCLHGWSSSGGEAMPEGSPQAGGCSLPPALPDPMGRNQASFVFLELSLSMDWPCPVLSSLGGLCYPCLHL